jgi:hypothetical protein
LIIEDLLYLGGFMYEFSNLLAQQDMIEDCVDLKFTNKELFYFDYKHHYGFFIKKISLETNSHLAEAVTGAHDVEDFQKAFYDCHNVNFEQLVSTIILMQENNEKHGGKMAMEEWYAYPKNLEHLFNVPYEKAEKIFKGLTLTKENKMTLRDAIFEPYQINKYLYRPILVWNVKGVDRAIVGEYILNEAIVSLSTNAIGWNKYPQEWSNGCFKEFVKAKCIFNDKILEDIIEKALINQQILYDRNVKNLKKWNNQNINIHNEKCGEIDFLFIHDDKIFICDSKHLISRYDMNNFRKDYVNFETGKKAFNKTMARKIAYLNDNLDLLEEHFQVVTNNKNLKVTVVDIEGIFVVNTPTFVMYNNDFRIYTLKGFKELLSNTYEDKVYQLLIDSEDKQMLLHIKYPYFRKPKYFVFNPDKED